MGLGAGLTQERGTTFGLLGVPDLLGSLSEGMQGAQETPVGFVVPGDRAVALPSGATQLVEAPVVTGAGVGVGGDRLPVGQSQFRQACPGGRVGGIASGDRCGSSTAASASRASGSSGRCVSGGSFSRFWCRIMSPILPPARAAPGGPSGSVPVNDDARRPCRPRGIRGFGFHPRIGPGHVPRTHAVSVESLSVLTSSWCPRTSGAGRPPPRGPPYRPRRPCRRSAGRRPSCCRSRRRSSAHRRSSS